MELNPYGLCPCLSGEKLKFCCPRELHADLGRIIQFILDDKLVVAREMVQRLSQRFPRQHCLVAAELLLDSLELNAAGIRKNVELLRQLKPSHGAILDAEVLLACLDGEPKRALACLNRSVMWRRQLRERVGENNPVLGVPLAELICQLCFRRGVFFPIFMLTVVSHYDLFKPKNEDDQQGGDVESLWRMQLAGDDQIPLAIRDQHRARLLVQLDRLKEQEIFELVLDAALLEALKKASARQQQHPEEPEWCYIVGVLAGSVLENDLAAENLRRYGEHPDADESWAISSLLLAEVLKPRQAGIPVREYRVLVSDVERLMETLLSEPRLATQAVREWDFEEGPPPKGQFVILDRPRPPSSSEPGSPGDWPRVVGWIQVFGKETDQPARAVLQVIGEEPEQFVRQCIGQHVDESWQLLGQVQLNPMQRGWIRPRIPPAELSLFEYLEKLAQVTKHDILQTWLDFPHPLLDGLTPRQASTQDKRRALLAALLDLETSLPVTSLGITLDELWDELKLARHVSQDGEATEEESDRRLWSGTIYWWLRQDYHRLSPRNMAMAASYMMGLGGGMAARLVLASLERADELSEYHDVLLSCASAWASRLQDRKLRVHYLREARKRFHRVEQRHMAAVMLRECEALLYVDGDQVIATLDEYQQRFGHDPELLSWFHTFVSELERRSRRAGAQLEQSPPAEESPRLWTPDQQVEEQPAPARKLWVPGS